MKKIILSVFLMVALGFTYSSCDDGKDEYISDFSTILYFLNSGEQEVPLYKTGENTGYTFTINKGGSDYNSSATAGIDILDASALTEYNTEKGTDFTILPSGCYEFQSSLTQSFDDTNPYKTIEMTFFTNAIAELPEASQYVLPLSLTSNDSVNSDKNILLVLPQVIIPTIYFASPGYVQNTFSDGGETTIALTQKLAMPFENKWSFYCTVSVDEDLLDQYNQENDVAYSLLPTKAYTMNEGGRVSFAAEDLDLNTPLNINIDRTTLSYGNYVLPLRLSDCSMEAFVIDETKDACLYGVSYTPDISKLEKIPLTAGMLSTNAAEPSEGSLANLLDGNTATYFHSAWSVSVSGYHYVQVALDEEITAFNFDYIGRASGGAGNPGEIILSGSTDGVNFSKITTITEGLPTTAAGAYTSPVIVTRPARYIRFTVPRNINGGSFFVWSEFGMKGI